MLQCFSDDSGSDIKDNGVFALYGYLMEHSRWEDFAELWSKQLTRKDFFPIKYFKMFEAHSGEGEFAGIREDFRKRKVQDLAEVIRDCNPTPIGCQLEWSDYSAVFKGKVPPRLDNPYAILFYQIMSGVSELQIQINDSVSDDFKRAFEEEHGIEFAIKPVEFIFDNQNHAGLQALGFWPELQANLRGPHRVVMSNTPQFKNDKDILPLQAADMLAWHMRRQNDYRGEDRSVILNMLAPDGLFTRQINRRELEGLAAIFNHQFKDF